LRQQPKSLIADAELEFAALLRNALFLNGFLFTPYPDGVLRLLPTIGIQSRSAIFSAAGSKLPKSEI
jgi:hypothetical protein